MRGVNSDDILAIVDFLYRGEANVFQENLDSFLAIAEELQLKGLMGKSENKPEDFELNEKAQPPFSTVKIPKTSFRRQVPSTKIHNPEENTTLAIPNSFSGDLDELEEMVKSMMEKSQNQYRDGKHGKADRCKVCGKEGMSSAIKDHIEANHLKGIVIPFNLCDKTFRSRNALRLHKRQHQN